MDATRDWADQDCSGNRAASPFSECGNATSASRNPGAVLVIGRASLFVTLVANLKPARALALDEDFTVQRAQFDLANVTASSVDFFRDQRRASP